MRTEIDLPNQDERLYPGMYAEVSLEMDRRPDVLTVPNSAVGKDGEGSFVYTIADDRIKRTPVQIGTWGGGRIQLLDGLSEQDANVTDLKRAPAIGTTLRASIVGNKS